MLIQLLVSFATTVNYYQHLCCVPFTSCKWCAPVGSRKIPSSPVGSVPFTQNTNMNGRAMAIALSLIYIFRIKNVFMFTWRMRSLRRRMIKQYVLITV